MLRILGHLLTRRKAHNAYHAQNERQQTVTFRILFQDRLRFVLFARHLLQHLKLLIDTCPILLDHRLRHTDLLSISRADTLAHLIMEPSMQRIIQPILPQFLNFNHTFHSIIIAKNITIKYIKHIPAKTTLPRPATNKENAPFSSVRVGAYRIRPHSFFEK